MFPELPYAFGKPPVTGQARVCPEDFMVEEALGFEPDGVGEHLFVHIRKREANTDWVARGLARWAGVRPVDVSYAGLKDRQAVTTQWFSIYLPGRADPDPAGLRIEGVELLALTRHARKLRRGALLGNRFQLRVRQLQGDCAGIGERLARVAAEGVPNYFGPQRFGRDGGNVTKAMALFTGAWRERDRHKRGIYVSAARSQLFNQVLAARVAAKSWNQLLEGECVMLDGSGSFFKSDAIDETLRSRLRSGDLHPSGPLWGRGPLPCGGEAAALESSVLCDETVLRAGLEAEGLKQERRSLRLRPTDLTWDLATDDTLTLGFHLPAGGYATAVLREIVGTGGTVD